LLAAIISNDVAVTVTLAGNAHGDFRFLHHRTHIAENGGDFCTLSESLIALVAIVVIAVALLAQQKIEIVNLKVLSFQDSKGPLELVLQTGDTLLRFVVGHSGLDNQIALLAIDNKFSI